MSGSPYPAGRQAGWRRHPCLCQRPDTGDTVSLPRICRKLLPGFSPDRQPEPDLPEAAPPGRYIGFRISILVYHRQDSQPSDCFSLKAVVSSSAGIMRSIRRKIISIYRQCSDISRGIFGGIVELCRKMLESRVSCRIILLVFDNNPI